MATQQHHQVLIIGGGAAGITVAAELRKDPEGSRLDIAIVEPSDSHYYQPAFTLVGAGTYSLSDTRRPEEALIPRGVKWIRAAAAGFDPAQNQVELSTGERVGYDYLVVCPGLQLDWDRIEGLRDALGRNGVASNYSPQYAEYTWECIQNLKPGARVLCTQSPMPFKCPGAPQKIAYLAADHLQRLNMLKNCEVRFLTHAPAIFGVPFFAERLVKIAARYGINVHYQTNLVAVDAAARKATFEIVGGDQQGQRVTYEYDLLHVTPYQSPPAAVKSSPLANAAGMVDVNQNSLRHNKFENVFGLGDATSTPNSKTAAAVRKQAPVVVRNLLDAMRKRSPSASYDGYASCPLTTAYGKVIMAEFIYGGKVTPTLPFDPGLEHSFYWWVKKTGLPIFYWNYMLKGHVKFFAHQVDWQAKMVPA